KEIRIDELVPVYKAEWQYAEANGYPALQEKLTAAQVQEVIDFQRPAVVEKPVDDGQLKPVGTVSNSEKVRQQFEKEYGPIALQLTDLTVESDPLIQISGNIIYPTKKYPYYVVFTLGVSNNIPPNVTHNEAYEMMMKLPLDWVASEEEWTLPEKNWPLRMMAEFGYYVHKNLLKYYGNTTFPVEGKTKEILFEYTKMTHLLARGPSESFVSTIVNEEFLVILHQLIPIYESEMDYAEGIYGVDLIHCLEKQHAEHIFVQNRPPSV
uniref:suppressor of fused domain protein n=1 Tax=Kurthia sp. Dielmo TaxID=1033738 RepID=UPI0011219D44